MEESEIEGEILTPQEAAKVAKVSTPSIRAAIARGELRATDIGSRKGRNHWRIARRALLTWLGIEQNHTVSTGGNPD